MQKAHTWFKNGSSKNEEVNKNDLIEIHQEILDKLIQIPSASKRKIQKCNCLLDKI